MDQTPTITRVEPRRVDIKRPVINESPTPAKTIPIEPYVGESEQNMTIGDYVRAAGLVVSLTPHLLKLIYGLIMKSWKTTLGAIIAAVASLVNALGIVTITPEVQVSILSVALFIIGFFAKDETTKA